MPNHITNKVTVDAVNAEEIIESLRTDKSDFDFNTIAPTPKCLEGFAPHHGVILRAKNACGVPVHDTGFIGSMELESRRGAIVTPCSDEDIDAVIKALQCYRETGSFYWHDWSLSHWGTKWNSYSVSIEENTVTFDTAWAHPTEIMLALSAQYPNAEFRCVYADEDMGANCGEINYQDGKIIHEYIAPLYSNMSEEEKEKWLHFALDVKGYTKEEKEKYFEGFED